MDGRLLQLSRRILNQHLHNLGVHPIQQQHVSYASHQILRDVTLHVCYDRVGSRPAPRANRMEPVSVHDVVHISVSADGVVHIFADVRGATLFLKHGVSRNSDDGRETILTSTILLAYARTLAAHEKLGSVWGISGSSSRRLRPVQRHMSPSNQVALGHTS